VREFERELNTLRE
jgi:regulator of protease activity HflC (stomatin/prohibitin superfamily)